MDQGDLGRGASHGGCERRSSASSGDGRWLTCPGDQARSGNGNTNTSRTAPSSGESTTRAEEVAARTVNKERARSAEAKTASRTSKQDMSSSRRGGLRSHSGPGGPTYEQLYSEARRRNVKGRSSMNKAQLARALGR